MRATIFISVIFAAAVAAWAAGPERAFWKQFKKHEKALYEAQDGDPESLEQLRAALVRLHPKLVLELGPKPENGPRDLTISADGALEAFPMVFFLVDGAPRLKRWRLHKFRQRLPIEGTWEIGDRKIETDQIHHLIYTEENPKKVGIMLFFPDYRPKGEAAFEAIAREILYRALGEFDATARVERVIARDQGSHFFEQAHPLSLLPQSFDAHFKNLP